MTIFGAKGAHNASITLACSANIAQITPIFYNYRDKKHRYPTFADDGSLSDQVNWEDLFGSTEADQVTGSFSTLEIRQPRLPRKFEKYTGSVDALICPGQGPSGEWRDLGPYYAVVKLKNGRYFFRGTKEAKFPLAGCQYPQYNLRHGEIKNNQGVNNHVFLEGSVKTVKNPQSWDDN